MPKSHLGGEVSDEVFNRELIKYLQRREANPDAKKVPAQFTHNGTKYYFERSPTESGFRVRRSADFVRKEQRRRKNLNRPKLSSIEKMMVDNIYDEASKRGLVVDHKYPAAKGGMHHPSNLGLMQAKINGAKGDKVGGNYPYEPLIKPAANGDLHIHSHHMTTKHLRNAAKGLAVGGVVALGPLGTAASASETAIRSQIATQTGNPLDQFQALLSGFSLAADAASYAPPATIPATIASTAADVVNGGIDTGRDIYKTLLGK
jgi:hypothetical protein